MGQIFGPIVVFVLEMLANRTSSVNGSILTEKRGLVGNNHQFPDRAAMSEVIGGHVDGSTLCSKSTTKMVMVANS